MERKCDNENEVFMFFLWCFYEVIDDLGQLLGACRRKYFQFRKKESPKLSDSAARGNYVRPCYRNFEVPDQGLRACVLIMIYAIFHM